MALDFSGIDVPPEVQEQLNAQEAANIAKEVGGLKSKNEEIMGKYQSTKERLTAYDGIDPEKTRKILSDLEKDQDLQMLKDGKLDELVEKRTNDIKLKFDDEKKGLTTNLEQITGERDTYKTQLEQHVVGSAVGKVALDAKALPTALDDITRRAMDIFQVTENGELEARNADGTLMKTEEGDLLTPARFIEGLKASAPHYWPPSQGGGLTGDGDESGSDLEKRMAKAADEGDMETYEKLRKQREKAKKG